MGLVQFNFEQIQRLTASIATSSCSKEQLLKSYSDVFNGELGCLEGTTHLETDPTVRKVQLPVRKTPVATKKLLHSELDRLQALGVVEKIDRPKDWVSCPITVKKSNGNVRICLDPKPLNRALKRSHYPVPTLTDILPELTKARIFTLADVRNGFWDVQLDCASSDLTTFNTPFGRYCWRRLPFGISPAPEIFQRKLHEALEGLDGVHTIADDILIVGNGDTDKIAVEDHNRKLIQLLERCRNKGIKLNKDKLRLRLPSVTYLGHILTPDGLLPDPQKTKAIQEMLNPTSVKDVRRFLGMVNYLSPFLSNLTDLREPLRQLTRNGVPWQWSYVEEAAMERVKQAITTAPVLKYYDPAEPLKIQSDESETGLGAVLIQAGHPVAYASRALSSTETQYAQIEKELLAVVSGFERFHQQSSPYALIAWRSATLLLTALISVVSVYGSIAVNAVQNSPKHATE